MKKAIVGVIGAIVLLAGGSAAQAYPPSEPTLIIGEAVLAPGEEFEVAVEGCIAGETVDFSVEGSSDSVTCATEIAGFAPSAPAAGSATGTLTAPTEPGTYTVTATLQESGESASGEITVVAEDDDEGDDGAAVPGDGDAGGELPETGSSATTPLLQIGGLLLLVGLGVTGVSYVRRHRRTSAA